MSLAIILRRSASRAVPLAADFVGGQRNFHRSSSAMSSAVASVDDQSQHVSETPGSDHPFSKALHSLIESAQKPSSQDVEEVPKDFPFKIEENNGQKYMTLSREYRGETINVKVELPELFDEEDDEKCIWLEVNVAKSCGTILKLSCTGYPNRIYFTDCCLSINDTDNSGLENVYEGPSGYELNENLRKAFQKYLEARGITPSIINFLHDYCFNYKERRENLMWLKKIKKFVDA